MNSDVNLDFSIVSGPHLRFADPEVERTYRKLGREKTKEIFFSTWAGCNVAAAIATVLVIYFDDEPWDYDNLPSSYWVIIGGRVIAIILFQILLIMWRVSHTLSPECIEYSVYVLCTLLLFIGTGPQNHWRVGTLFHGDGLYLDHMFGGGISVFCSHTVSDTRFLLAFCVVSTIYSRIPVVRASRAWVHLMFVYIMFVGMTFPPGFSPWDFRDQCFVALFLAFLYYCVITTLFSTEKKARVQWASQQRAELHAKQLREAEEARRSSMISSVSELRDRELMDALEHAVDMEQAGAIAAARQAMLSDTWTPLDLDAKVASIRKEQSEARGVTLSYLLSDEFEKLARTASGLSDPNFHDLVQPFFFGPNAIGRDKICPRDGQKGCALVDSLPCSHRKRCTHFLSWTWSSKLNVVREALRRWAHKSSSNPADVSFFMCFFVNNQYRILAPEASAAGSHSLGETFERNLLRTKHMVALLETFDRPTYLTRIWTIFEQFTAMRLGVEVEVALPQLPSDSLIAEFERGRDGIMRVRDAVSTVDSAGARASDPTDELNVKNAIRHSVGFKEVDEAIKRVMCEWVHTELRIHMDRIMRDVSGQPTSATT
jgi:hypothetical protein